MISATFDRALQMVQTYLAECGEDPGDPRTAEHNEVIGNCVGWMSVNHRGHGRASDARVPQEAFWSDCVSCTLAIPGSFSWPNSSRMTSPWLEWTLPVGSPPTRRWGPAMIARAPPTNSCCPPES